MCSKCYNKFKERYGRSHGSAIKIERNNHQNKNLIQSHDETIAYLFVFTEQEVYNDPDLAIHCDENHPYPICFMMFQCQEKLKSCQIRRYHRSKSRS